MESLKNILGTFKSNDLNLIRTFVSSCELRPAIKGVNFSAKNGNVTATNGFYLFTLLEQNISITVVDKDNPIDNITCVVPKLPANKDVVVLFNNTNVFFECAEIEFVSEIITNNFPTYYAPFYDNYIEFESDELIQALKQIKLPSKKENDNLVCLIELVNNSIKLTELETDKEVNIQLKSVSTSEALKSTFNFNELLKCLKAFKGSVKMFFSNSTMAVEFRQNEEIVFNKKNNKIISTEIKSAKTVVLMAKNNNNMIDKNILPPVSLYREYLNKACCKFNLSIDECRDRYGKFTIEEWNNLLKD